MHQRSGSPGSSGDDVERAADPHHERTRRGGQRVGSTRTPCVGWGSRGRGSRAPTRAIAVTTSSSSSQYPSREPATISLGCRSSKHVDDLGDDFRASPEEVHGATVVRGRSTSRSKRSMPATRAGNGAPSSLLAHTTEIPSALTRSQERMISLSAGSCSAATTLAAFTATCWCGRPSSTMLRTTSTVSSIVSAST